MKNHRLTLTLDLKNKILDGDYSRRDREVTYIYGTTGFVYEKFIASVGMWIVMDECAGFAANATVEDLLQYVEPRSGADVPQEAEVEVVDSRPAAIWAFEYPGEDGDELLDVWGRVV